MGTTKHTIIRQDMGQNMSAEQHQSVLRGEAVWANYYYAYPNGLAAKSIWGSYKLDDNGNQTISSQRVSEWRMGKIDIEQAAVTEMMVRRGASELYAEFMRAVYEHVDGWTWGRKKLLALRNQYSPRFFALGIDVWACSHHQAGAGGKEGHNEYWVLFVDRSVAPDNGANVREMIGWKQLMWGMGSGQRQDEMAPIIEQYLQQRASATAGEWKSGSLEGDDDSLKKETGTMPTVPIADFASDIAPPPYTEADQIALQA